MKQYSENVAKVRRLVNRMKKEEAAAEPSAIEDMMDLLLHCILSTRAAETRALTAAHRLRGGTVDLNDLRVSSVTEMVEMIGADYPMCRAAAEEIVATMTSVFNRRHSLDLSFLDKLTRKGCEQFLNSLAGLGPHAKALFILRSDKGKALPLDWNMYAFLQKGGYVPMELDAEAAHKFMAMHVKEPEMESFYLKLKKYAAAHAPKKWPEFRKPEPAPAAPAPEPVAAAAAPEPRKSVKELARELARTRKSTDGKAARPASRSTSRSRSKPAARRR
jgi:endonuclease III